MILKTEIGNVYANITQNTKLQKYIYSILSVPYARAKRLEYPTLITKDEYDRESIINREETLCFPQKKYPFFLNTFLKHHMMRPEFLPLKDIQTEDAFVVNIWTSGLVGKKPVVVFIHGGGEGSGTVPLYTMPHIAEQDVVAVAITYRIGNFGYMPTFDEDEIVANLAYYDQQTALKWIKNNIQYFGGDNENITLMGHCGGAVAALYHFLNPISNKLFNKLMLCAGNMPMLTDINSAKETYKEVMQRNHFKNREDLIKMPTQKFMKIRGAMNDLIDGQFFKQDLLELLKNAEFPEMPVLIGSNKDEFSMIELPMYYKTLGIATKDKDLDELLSKKYGQYAKELREAVEPEAKDIIDLQIQIMELLVFHSSALFLMEKISKKCSVYGYRLNYVPNLYDGLRGSYHGAELAFFFGTLDQMNIEISEENKEASFILQEDWIEFIKMGNISSRALFNDNREITEYDKIVRSIPFSHAELIHKLEKTNIASEVRQSYIKNRS